MAKKRTKTLVFYGLGFPIKLIDVSMKKMAGEWVIDINMEKLMLTVFEFLAHKPRSLTDRELHFIRSYLKMSMKEFGKLFGVSHVAVLKWESGKTKISPALEFYVRLYILNHIQAKGEAFKALYNEIPLEQLSKVQKGKIHPISVNVDGPEDLSIAL